MLIDLDAINEEYNYLPTYNFEEQLEIGERHEKELDNRLENLTICLRLEKLKVEEQIRWGIDRIFYSKAGNVFSLEYKTDLKAYSTGNFFIETISSDTPLTRGWALKTLAQHILFYVPQEEKVWAVSAWHLKQKLKDWEEKYEEGICCNETYNTKGLKVPRKEIEDMADYSLKIPKEE